MLHNLVPFLKLKRIHIIVNSGGEDTGDYWDKSSDEIRCQDTAKDCNYTMTCKKHHEYKDNTNLLNK